MTKDEIIDFVDGLDGVLTVRPGPGDGSPDISWGDTFFYYAPDGVVPTTTQPFATIVTKNYPGDEASRLDRPDTFRVNVAAGKEAFIRWTGHAPRDPAPTETDPGTADTVMAHPVYGTVGWLAVVNPGPRTEPAIRELLHEAHHLARSRHERRAASTLTSQRVRVVPGDWRTDRIGAALRGENPTVVRRLDAGFAAIGDVQFLPGYSVLLVDEPGVQRLSDLPRTKRLAFLSDMEQLGEAVERSCRRLDPDFRRINLEILGNTDPFLHAHIWPRFEWEPAESVGKPVWLYPQDRWSDERYRLGPRHDVLRDAIGGELDRLRSAV